MASSPSTPRKIVHHEPSSGFGSGGSSGSGSSRQGEAIKRPADDSPSKLRHNQASNASSLPFAKFGASPSQGLLTKGKHRVSSGSLNGTPSSTSAAASQRDPLPTLSNGTASIDGGSRNVDPRIAIARTKLPIWIARDAIVDAVKENDTVVVLGETGSGKTTQIPQFLFDGGLAGRLDKPNKRRARRQMIGITQPRRVAAITLAKRVAMEMGYAEPGDRAASKQQRADDTKAAPSFVGYSVRFDDSTSRSTRIKFMTDGWLLRELLSCGAERPGNKAKRRQSTLTSSQADDDEDDDPAAPSHSLLEQYSVIIIDEAHERSVHTDVVLGLVKRVQQERKRRVHAWWKRKTKANGTVNDDDDDDEAAPTELKVVVMSATIDADAFARFFASPTTHEPAPILYIKGRQFPIKLMHAQETCQDWTQSCKKIVVQINMIMTPGDVLVFMTGAEEIEALATELRELDQGMQAYAASQAGMVVPPKLLVVKLYAALGGEAIRQCFSVTPPGCRKIVLATNIAETSITISGIRYVIDCGLAKERSFGLATAVGGATGGSTEMLAVKEISKAAARQRAGRAGRDASGQCFRLYTADTFDKLADSTLPEIMRTDLSSVVLDVFAMGLDPLSFDWLDRPDDDGFRAAVMNLVELGALEPARRAKSDKKADDSDNGDDDGQPAKRRSTSQFRLTPLGREMSKLPLVPSLSKTLLTARDFSKESQDDDKVFRQALDLVSILSTERRTLLVEPSMRIDESSGQVKGGNSKREAADRARERLAHRSGDHATQLRALYAFEDMEESCRTDKVASLASNGKQRSTVDMARLKEWCMDNYVSLKAVREAGRIRAQLMQVCKREGWISDAGEQQSSARERSRIGEDSDDDSAASDDSECMLVTRGSTGQMANGEEQGGEREDFATLRRCLIQGKRLNTAVRQGHTRIYLRAHGGHASFRIHPSSTLLLNASSDTGAGGASSGLPAVIYFEDLVFTSQLFARTVSAIEPSWLTDMTSELRTRRNLQPV